MKLLIEMHLGNEAMQTAEEVTIALKGSMGRARLLREAFRVGDVGAIHDVNGNSVGRWEVVEA